MWRRGFRGGVEEAQQHLAKLNCDHQRQHRQGPPIAARRLRLPRAAAGKCQRARRRIRYLVGGDGPLHARPRRHQQRQRIRDYQRRARAEVPTHLDLPERPVDRIAHIHVEHWPYRPRSRALDEEGHALDHPFSTVRDQNRRDNHRKDREKRRQPRVPRLPPRRDASEHAEHHSVRGADANQEHDPIHTACLLEAFSLAKRQCCRCREDC